MSGYENYSRTAGRYDATRRPVGVEIITGCLARGDTPLNAQHLLDAGCGTGSYSLALLARVRRISAVDLNDAMLARARKKLADACARGRIDFHRASIDALPFGDGVFDGIMVNQVLHHLELAAADDYPVYRRVFAEFARVLKPGGALVVNTCSPEQLRRGFWYYALIPEATAQMCARHAPLDVLRRLMHDTGIAYRQRFVPVDALMQGDAYFNPRGPLDEAWRDGDSMWNLVSEGELKKASARLRELEQAGALQDYLRKNDAHRQHIGQFSFLYGQREQSKPVSNPNP